MTSYYLSAQLSRYVDEMGGRDFLAGLVERDMTAAPEPDVRDVRLAAHPDLRYCTKCGLLLQHPGADICFSCGERQR